MTIPVPGSYERRAARAELLIPDASSAREPLRFAAGLYRVQGRAAEKLANTAAGPLTGRLEEDADRVLEEADDIVRYAAESGPSRLAEEALRRRTDLPATQRTRLFVYWSGDAPEDYLTRAVIRPYVEVLHAAGIAPDRVHRQGRCPFCAGGPWAAARREGSMFEGARRMLCCALCGTEWLFERIRCPACFEGDPAKLPSFQNENHPEVRIEACETCRRYVKSIDLSEDARPIPEVDDLATLALDLWAVEEGFRRIEPGLAGI